MAKITLQFNQDGDFSLERIQFAHPLLDRDRISVRGKGITSIGAYGSFQWSAAVQGLCLLLLKTKLSSVLNLINETALEDASEVELQGSIQGGSHTLAASLDYAISKQPVWLKELFGVDKQGTSLIRRLVYRHNPERKRPGDTVIGVNAEQLSGQNISVIVGRSEVKEMDGLLKLVGWIESQKGYALSVSEPSKIDPVKSVRVAGRLKRRTGLPISNFESLPKQKAA